MVQGQVGLSISSRVSFDKLLTLTSVRSTLVSYLLGLLIILAPAPSAVC